LSAHASTAETVEGKLCYNLYAFVFFCATYPDLDLKISICLFFPHFSASLDHTCVFLVIFHYIFHLLFTRLFFHLMPKI